MKIGVTPVTHQDRMRADPAQRVEDQAYHAVQWMLQGQPMAHTARHRCRMCSPTRAPDAL
jgi:hypothetical protein